MPYETVQESNENSSDNALSEYLYHDEWILKMKITLYQPYADRNVMDKIKDSFKFAGGSYNVIDMESTAVNVNVMEFIPDGPNDNSPNVFIIENLKYTETYSLGFGVNVAALVPPNYTTYNSYYMKF